MYVLPHDFLKMGSDYVWSLDFHIALDHMSTSNFFLPPTVTFPSAVSKTKLLRGL